MRGDSRSRRRGGGSDRAARDGDYIFSVGSGRRRSENEFRGSGSPPRDTDRSPSPSRGYRRRKPYSGPTATVQVLDISQGSVTEQQLRDACGLAASTVIRAVRVDPRGLASWGLLEFFSREQASAFFDAQVGKISIDGVMYRMKYFRVPPEVWTCPLCGGSNLPRKSSCYHCHGLAPSWDDVGEEERKTLSRGSFAVSSGLIEGDPELEAIRTKRTVVVVRGIDPASTKRSIAEAFSAVAGSGAVLGVKIAFDSHGSPKGYCYVEFASVDICLTMIQQKMLIVDGASVDIENPRGGEPLDVRAHPWSPARRRERERIPSWSESRGGAASAKSSRPSPYLGLPSGVTPEFHEFLVQGGFQYDSGSGWYTNSITRMHFDPQSGYFFNEADCAYYLYDASSNSFVKFEVGGARNDASSNDGKRASLASVVDAGETVKNKSEAGPGDVAAVSSDGERRGDAVVLDAKPEGGKLQFSLAQRVIEAKPVLVSHEDEFADENEGEVVVPTDQKSKTELEKVHAPMRRFVGGTEKKMNKEITRWTNVQKDMDVEVVGEDAGDFREERVSELQAPDHTVLPGGKAICLVCMRQFADEGAWEKHCSVSQLHKQNLEKRADRRVIPPRGRGSPDPARIRKTHHTHGGRRRRQDGVGEVQARKGGQVVAGVGAALLKKMGWNEGEGLGARRDGPVDIAPVTILQDRAGLGVDGTASSTAVLPTDSRREANMKRARQRWERDYGGSSHNSGAASGSSFASHGTLNQ